MSTIVKQKITPYLWFDHQAHEAANYYCFLFKNSRITTVSELIVEFELEGMKFIALNGGPAFTFTEAVSFLVLCESQEEIDYFWDALTSDGGAESMCGWCKDKYGLSWQIVPARFLEMMKTGTPEQTKKAMDALMKMKKIILAELEEAFLS